MPDGSKDAQSLAQGIWGNMLLLRKLLQERCQELLTRRVPPGPHTLADIMPPGIAPRATGVTRCWRTGC